MGGFGPTKPVSVAIVASWSFTQSTRAADLGSVTRGVNRFEALPEFSFESRTYDTSAVFVRLAILPCRIVPIVVAFMDFEF